MNNNLSILRFPFDGVKVRRIVPNDYNLVTIANDFFFLGDPFKARLFIWYLCETRKGGYKRLDLFLSYLSKICRPYGVQFVKCNSLSNFKRFYHG